MQPGTITTTEIWQWRCPTCRADWKMLRQVTTCCPCPHGHACRCCQGTPPPARNLPPTPHHHRQEEGASRALAAAEGPNAGRHVAAALNPTPPVAVAGPGQVCWVPEPYLMVQQLREFESLNDEVVALRVQLQEYSEEIDRSKRDNAAGVDCWFLALPPNVRDVLVMARDTIESFVAISTAAPAKH